MWGILGEVLTRFRPEHRNVIQLSFALSDRKRLETLFTSAGFQDIRVEREIREDVIASFDDYWDPIKAGTGSQPQVYLTLSEVDRRLAREEVRARLDRQRTRVEAICRTHPIAEISAQCKSTPVISTFPSSVNWRRRSFRSAMHSNRVRWR